MIEAVKNKKISPFIAFSAIYLFCTPLDFLPIVPGVSIAKILVLLPLIGVLLEAGKFSKSNKEATPVFLYLLVAGLTLVYTINMTRSLDRSISVGLNTVLIFVFSLRKYRKDEFQHLLKAYVYSAWLLLALIVIYADFSSNSGRMTVAVNGQEQDPNYLTGFFTFSICYYLYGFIQQKKKAYLIFSILFFIPIFLTGSRGGLLANGFAVLSLLFFYRKKINFGGIMAVAVSVGLFLAITWAVLPEAIKVRYSLAFTESDGGAHRFDIWRSCWETFERASILRKFLGFGAGSIGHLNYGGGAAHNLFIEFLLEYGIIGGAIVIGMLIYYVSLAYKKKEFHMVAVFIGYLIMMMSLSLYSYKPMWNLLMFIILMCKLSLQTDKGAIDTNLLPPVKN